MYELHNFTTGRELHASELNDMEDQIYTNEESLIPLNTFINGIDAYTAGLIENIELTSDGVYLKLYNDDKLINAVGIPYTLDDYAPPSSVSLSATKYVLVNDETIQMQAALTPARVSLQKRFVSSVPSVAAVNRYGLVSAKGIGKTNITLKCGSLQDTKSIRVDLFKRPNTLKPILWGVKNEDDDFFSYVTPGTKSNLLIGVDSGLYIPPNCYGKFIVDETDFPMWRLYDICIMTTDDDNPPVDIREKIYGNIIHYEVTNETEKEHLFRFHNETNKKSYLIGMIYTPETHTITPEEIESFISTAVSLELSVDEI